MSGLTGLVLAAGRGTRFDPSGQHNKLLATLPNGQSVLKRACLALAPHVEQIVVVLRAPCERIQTELADLDVTFVYSCQADLGLGYSLAQSIAQTQATKGWLVTLGDLPFISAASYQQVIAAFEQNGGIVRPSYQGQIGHPVLFAAELKADLQQVEHADGPKHIFRHYSHLSQTLAVSDAGVCADIDYPEHLTRPLI